MVAAVGESVKASLASVWRMAQFTWRNYTGMKQPELAARNSKSSICFETGPMAKPQTKQLVVCISNKGYEVSLEKRKIYVVLKDGDADEHQMFRIVDESGDDYLYPKTMFRPIALPRSVKQAVLAAA